MSGRRPALPTLLLALALTVGIAAEARAQQVDRAAAGARHVAARAVVAPAGGLTAFADTAQADSARRRPIGPYLLGGALAGALVGALLAQSFNDSFCGEPAPGYSCSTTSPAAGAVMGAGVGVIVGGFLWVLTRSAGSAPPAGRARRTPPRGDAAWH